MRRPAAALLAALVLGAALASRGSGQEGAPAAEPSRRTLYEREVLASLLELADAGTPFFTLDPEAWEVRLLVNGVPLSRFPSERHLVSGRLERLLERREPGSIVSKPFRWAGLDAGPEAGGVGSYSLRLEPAVRVDFEASPSDFFWRSLRFRITDRLGGGRASDAMSAILFYPPDSLAALAPLLADSLPVLFVPADLAPRF